MLFCDDVFMGRVNMKNVDRFKCHMNTDRNHDKDNFINIANRTTFLRQKTVKQVFQNGLN